MLNSFHQGAKSFARKLHTLFTEAPIHGMAVLARAIRHEMMARATQFCSAPLFKTESKSAASPTSVNTSNRGQRQTSREYFGKTLARFIR
jgi:hypothetical protein